MLFVKIAFRNLFRQKRRTLLTALSLIIGFVLASLAVGLGTGTYSSIIDMFTRNYTGHIQVHRQLFLDQPSIGKTLNDPGKLIEKILNHPKVMAVSPRVVAGTLIITKNKTLAGRIVGIDLQREIDVTNIPAKVKTGKFISKPGGHQVVISHSLAVLLGVETGGEVILISQGRDGSIANDLFTVTGIMGEDTDALESNNIYTDIVSAQQFYSLADHVHELVIRLNNQSDALSVAADLTYNLDNPELDVSPWQVVEQAFYRSMQADLVGNYIFLGIIIFIVVIGVLNAILMNILERTREFGILRALGTSPPQLVAMIITECFFLSLASSLIGVVISMPVNYYLSTRGIKYPTPFDMGGISFDRLLSEVSWATTLLPLLAIVLSSVLISIIPAIRASRVAPVKAIRDLL